MLRSACFTTKIRSKFLFLTRGSTPLISTTLLRQFPPSVHCLQTHFHQSSHKQLQSDQNCGNLFRINFNFHLSPLSSSCLCSIQEDNMADARYCVEYAKTGRSSCKKCKSQIEKGVSRIGKITPNPFSDDGGEMKVWYHTRCMFETLKVRVPSIRIYTLEPRLPKPQ